MSAVMSCPAANVHSSTADRSVDELDAEIRRLARQMNIECYRMLVLVREFDDRFGWKKWGHKSCAEWLAWNCPDGLRARTENASRDGSCAMRAESSSRAGSEVREPAAIYRLGRSGLRGA